MLSSPSACDSFTGTTRNQDDGFAAYRGMANYLEILQATDFSTSDEDQAILDKASWEQFVSKSFKQHAVARENEAVEPEKSIK